MTDATPPAAVVLDIEGTTTPISFVYDVLFPFAREHVASFLERSWDDPDVQRDVRAIATGDGDDDVPDGPAEARRRATVDNVHRQMDRDAKTTGLKSLQGKIWRDGYARGTLRGEVFDDVPDAIRTWERLDIPVFIYSSGSIEAQKLLFGNSSAGDLTPLLNGYFDTTTGPKKEADSYTDIAGRIGRRSDNILFATDDLDEARAADEAGWRVVVMLRPGNAELPDHEFRTSETLAELAERHAAAR